MQDSGNPEIVFNSQSIQYNPDVHTLSNIQEPPNLDLNHNPTPCISGSSNDSDMDSANPNEISETVMVGKELGFQIELDDEILTTLVDENDDQNCYQWMFFH